MLREIGVRNFALIKEVRLDLSSPLVVLTGETGAGKSILMDALRFVLGERLDAIRYSPDQAAEAATFVEAVFDTAKMPRSRLASFQDFLEEGDTNLILRREVASDGRSRAWINGRSVNISQLRDSASVLVDIHGQYDHQQLLDPEVQRDLLDRYADNEELLNRYELAFADFQKLQARRREIDSLRQNREREMDLLKYQIEEIERVDPKENEEEELREARMRLVNAEKLSESARKLLAILDGDDASVSELLREASRELTSLVRLDPGLAPEQEKFQEGQLFVGELIQRLRTYDEELSFDESRLNEIQERLDQIKLLKKKYGSGVAEIREFLAQSQLRYDELTHAEVSLAEMDAQIQKQEPAVASLVESLRVKRKKSAAKLIENIQKELRELSLPHARFECALENIEWNSSGGDRIEFKTSLNAGQALAPLRSVVSAGEVSRLMLAFKRVLSKADQVPVLVFDEVDANIGGRLGTVIGEKLRDLARDHQVLLITHLPQIASFADRHYRVSKKVQAGRTKIIYEEIKGEERIRELSQMMSGKEETEISRKHAEEMLERVSSRS